MRDDASDADSPDTDGDGSSVPPAQKIDPAHYQERAQLANQHGEEASVSLMSASDMLKAAGISVTSNFLDAHSVPGQVSHEIP